MMVEKDTSYRISSYIRTFVLIALTILFIFPILLVLMNSFKSRLYVSTVPFAFPSGEMFVGLENYINGLTTSSFFKAFLRSVWISVMGVGVIILCTSMTAWYIVRVKDKFTKALYYVFVFSMIVPFQMVMYTLTFVVTSVYFDNIFGIVLVYLGFGAGLAVFMFCGFVKSIPLEVEEAATIDGCNPLQTYFLIVFPMLKPTAITVAILQAMWIWNDYLLPFNSASMGKVCTGCKVVVACYLPNIVATIAVRCKNNVAIFQAKTDSPQETDRIPCCT